MVLPVGGEGRLGLVEVTRGDAAQLGLVLGGHPEQRGLVGVVADEDAHVTRRTPANRVDGAVLEDRIRGLWSQRDDRYSEIRPAGPKEHRGQEMYRMGG